MPHHRRPCSPCPAAFALTVSLLSAGAAHATEAPGDRVVLPPTPSWLRPHRDDTGHPAVQAAGKLLRDKLWRPAPPDEATRRELGLPMQRLVNEDHGNITVVRGDNGELDVNWEDPNQLQDALLNIIESYYRAHPDRNPHFLTVVTTFQVQSLAAFYMPLANDVRGIGYQHSGRGGELFNYVGGGLALDGIIFMNNYRGYLGVYAPLGRLTFNQELGHRWGAHVAFDGRDGESMEMLGRDCSHWSFFMETQNSAMEGNTWVDRGNGTFITDTSFFEFGYSQLDRYLMGFAPPEAVNPWFFLTGVGAGDCSRAYINGEINPSNYPPIFGGAGQDQVSIRARRVDVNIDDVISAEGQRDPEYGASRMGWTMNIILAARRNDTISDRTIEQVDALRLEWERQWEQDATEPGYESPDLITALDGSNEPPEPPPPPNPGSPIGDGCLSFEDCDPAQSERCVNTNTGLGVCTKTCHENDDCPDTFCCVPSVPGRNQDDYDWYCMARTHDTCDDYSLPPEGQGGASGEGGAGGEDPTGGAQASGGEPAGGGDTPDGGLDPAGDDGGLTNTGDPGAGAVEKKSGSSGGCQSAPGRGTVPFFAALALLPVLLRRRRRS